MLLSPARIHIIQCCLHVTIHVNERVTGNLLYRSDGRLKRSRYTDVDVDVTLPDGIDVCDIGTFTIWCQPFNAIFTRIEISRDILVCLGSLEV